MKKILSGIIFKILIPKIFSNVLKCAKVQKLTGAPHSGLNSLYEKKTITGKQCHKKWQATTMHSQRYCYVLSRNF